jgi:lysophospholipase L1-like esterase
MRIKLALLAIAVACAAAPAAAAAKAPKKIYYVSLGDSLAVGYQPHSTGSASTTKHGYPNVLAKAERKRFKGLKLVAFGCAGETSGSIMSNSAACSYQRQPNQLAAADSFIRAHRRQIAFITIDIGANDVDGCAKNGSVDINCVTNGVATIGKNLPVIGKRLRQAAGKRATILGMTLYDPFLQYWLKGDDTSRSLASASVALAQSVNKTITTGFAKHKIPVAPVDTAFGTYTPFDQTTALAGQPGPVPVAVANICKYTFMCNPPPVGPNIHATNAGYQLIADTFAKALKK